MEVPHARTSRAVALTLVFVTTTAIAKPGQGVPGVVVVLKKKPGGSIARTVMSDSTGSFELRGLESGAYSLAIMGCAHTGSKSEPARVNGITRFLVANPGATKGSVFIAGPTCALSEHLPLRGSRTAEGTITVIGELPLDELAAGTQVEIEVGADRTIIGRITTTD